MLSERVGRAKLFALFFLALVVSIAVLEVWHPGTIDYLLYRANSVLAEVWSLFRTVGSAFMEIVRAIGGLFS